jgi:hypothetical protein
MKYLFRYVIIPIAAASLLAFNFISPDIGQKLTGKAESQVDFCSLVSKADVEKFFGEPSNEPTAMPGGCAFTNKKDGLYAFSLSAGQDKETSNILQSQAMLLGMAGVQLDNESMTKLKSQADAQDFAGFFEDLVALSKKSKTITAQLFAGGGNDLTYWAWITVPPRRSGAFTAVRGTTLVSMYLVVPESQPEETMLNEANQLANTIFGKLPEKFTIGLAPSAPPAQTAPTQAPATPVPQPTPTLVTGLPAPVQISPTDGKVFETSFPRTTTFTWSAVPGAKKYIFELMACSNGKPNDCFIWPVDKPKHEVQSTSYTFGFVGAQPGKWRVTAVDAKGISGTPSGWWTFRYKK